MRCAHCGAEFEAKTNRRRFCSAKCRAAAWQETRKGRLASLEDRLSLALAEVQAVRRSHVQRDDGGPSSADDRPPGCESPILRACSSCGAPALRTADETDGTGF